MFNAIQFYEDYGIKYWTSGKNVASGSVNVQCPFCGDHSNHLGFYDNHYNCWRCGSHGLVNTIMELINCDYKMASQILKQYDDGSDLVIPEEERNKIEHLDMIGETLHDIHKNYLAKRGFDPDYVEWKFGLKGTFARDDCWAYRIITPIVYKHRLVSYQGRDFTGKQELRYMTLGKDKEIIHHKDILFNLDNCNKDSVILVEGTYDVMKLDDNCCATFGIGYKDSQIALLSERFKRVFLMFDPEPDAQKRAEDIGRKLILTGVDVERIVLDEAEDAGALTLEQAKNVKKELGL